MAITTGISGNDSYFNQTSTLGLEYDFNNDGVVDINDYQFAKLSITDEDPSNDVELTLSELDTIFKSLLTGEKSVDNDDLSNDELNLKAEELLADVDNIEDPANATSLLDLQNIGKKLTERIQKYSDMAEVLGNKISTLKSELDALQAEKEQKEFEYEAKTAEVEEKSQELAKNIESTLDYSEKITNEKSQRCEELVDNAVKEYVEGKHPNMTLQAVITQALATNSNSSQLANLQSMINKNEGIGETINSLCSEIDVLVCDIKDVTERYNNKNTEYNRTVNNRNDILTAAQTASTKYQTGYEKRIELRNGLISKYSATGGGLDDNNGQIQSLSRFLNNGELQNMTFSDAWYILSNTFNNIKGLSFNSDYSISVPKGHSNYQKGVFDSLVSAISSFGNGKTSTVKSSNSSDKTASAFDDINITATCPDSGYSDGTTQTSVTGTNRTDPISFAKDGINYDFIIDRNGDGVFNDVNEFLGAKNGWSEMIAYDTNGDGHISGEELNNLKVVGTNQADGKFTFSTAAEAGISDIDLNSYKESNTTLTNNNLLAGSFSLTTSDGATVKGQQTYDTTQNSDNTYGFLYGSTIEDANNMYTENPFMAAFKVTLDTKQTVSNTNADIDNATDEADSTVKAGEKKDASTERAGIAKGNIEKNRHDEANKQDEEKVPEKANFEKLAEEKKTNKLI